MLDEDDDQQADGEDVAWEDDGEQDGGDGDDGESPIEFEIEGVDEEPEERRVRAL